MRGSKRYSDRDDLALEIRRQFFHLVLILLWCLPVYFLPYWANIFLMLSVLLLNYLVVKKHKQLLELFSPLIDSLERNRNLPRPGIQALWANLGIFLSYLFFGKLSLVGIVVLAVGDSLSTLVGKAVGRTPAPLSKDKTLEGTLAFFISSYLLLIPFLPFREALLISSLGALLESADSRIDDNFTIPVLTTALLYLV